ncbi:MAG: VOC family protein [Acidimicrobiales bacterium]
MATMIKTVLYPAKDLEATTALFTALVGTGPHVVSPYYVGFAVGDAEVGLLPLDQNPGMTGAEPFFDVDDIVAALAALSALGAETLQEPRDVGGGLLVAKVRDPNGSVIGLKQSPTVA